MKPCAILLCLTLLFAGCIGVPPTKKGVYEDPETRAIKTVDIVDSNPDVTLAQAMLIVVLSAAFFVMLMFHDQNCTTIEGVPVGACV